ncbi:hypothetical protein [Mucilaginibacter sp. SG564]|uniref:hypothetical protein n=1 Tax=Mucilaginibacter sp. SG564 TaxID=2587022 RepID=UPI0015538ADC|nr:hypothetical protein [Mucilaginibacter sp. SG564]NOW94970.1 hypothetical protein [Mucilaginibacter sp. SG564]
MSEQLFTNAELAAIIKEATDNEKRYLDTTVIDGKATAASISTISLEKKLIFTVGNEHTGYKHLRERHTLYIYKNYWITTDDGQVKLDRPSKFHPDMAPGIHITKIADAIFEPENKNVTTNHRPDVFDKYTGSYGFKDNPPEKYHLLTYKDSKIVHTMYPDKKKHNLKAVAKFGKGHVTATRDLQGHHADLLIPYENKDGKTAYSILIRKFYQEQAERVFIQEHGNDGDIISVFLLGEREINDFKSFDHPMMSRFQHTDLIDYERIINQMAEGAQTIELNPKTFRW